MENTSKMLEKPLTEPETQRVSNIAIWFEDLSQQTFACSKLAVEALEKSAKLVQN